MKTVELIEQGNFRAKEILLEIVGNAPQGINLIQMRERLAILDAVDKANGKLTLEDAPYRIVKDALEGAQWRLVSSDLMAVLDKLLTPEDGNG